MTKRKLMSAIALLLAMITVVSCGPTTQFETPETTLEITNDSTTAAIFDPSIPEGVLLAGPQISSSCAVVYPSGATTLSTAAENFANYFMKLIPGSNFTFRSPNTANEEDYQIVLATDATIESSFSVKLDGKTINVTGKDTDNTLQALSYLKLIAFVDGYFAIPEALDFVSGDGPVMFEYSPENLYYYEDVYTPSLYYKFADTMINKEACRLVLDGLRTENEGESALFCKSDSHSGVGNRLHDSRYHRYVKVYCGFFALLQLNERCLKSYVFGNTGLRGVSGDEQILTERVRCFWIEISHFVTLRVIYTYFIITNRSTARRDGFDRAAVFLKLFTLY